PAVKLRSLSTQAMSLDAANLREVLPERRYTLVVALLHQMRVREWLADAARQLDERFPEKAEHVTINKTGEFVVRRTTATIV
ncbi:hypothetical protein AB3X90_40915, partial [Paraburkholderia sp. BR14427]